MSPENAVLVAIGLPVLVAAGIVLAGRLSDNLRESVTLVGAVALASVVWSLLPDLFAGERPEENYLSFSFKGGAADNERKVARARLIGSLLEDRGFETAVVEDMVTARRTHLEQHDVERDLRIVGYLLMHTRQLDMIMNEPNAVNHYRAKMVTDIDGLMQA